MGRISDILTPKKIRKDLSKERKELESEIADARAASRNLPKAFNYYCPSCLWQTNEEANSCPKCGTSPLKRAD